MNISIDEEIEKGLSSGAEYLALARAALAEGLGELSRLAYHGYRARGEALIEFCRELRNLERARAARKAKKGG